MASSPLDKDLDRDRNSGWALWPVANPHAPHPPSTIHHPPPSTFHAVQKSTLLSPSTVRPSHPPRPIHQPNPGLPSFLLGLSGSTTELPHHPSISRSPHSPQRLNPPFYSNWFLAPGRCILDPALFCVPDHSTSANACTDASVLRHGLTLLPSRPLVAVPTASLSRPFSLPLLWISRLWISAAPHHCSSIVCLSISNRVTAHHRFGFYFSPLLFWSTPFYSSTRSHCTEITTSLLLKSIGRHLSPSHHPTHETPLRLQAPCHTDA